MIKIADNTVCIAGGTSDYGSYRCHSSSEVLDVMATERVWKRGPSLHTARERSMSWSFQDATGNWWGLVGGGRTGTWNPYHLEYLDSVEIYDGTQEKAKFVRAPVFQLPHVVAGAGAAVLPPEN